MSFRDGLKQFGLGALGSLGEVMTDFAGSALQKAGKEKVDKVDKDEKADNDLGGRSDSDRALGGSREDTAINHPVPTDKSKGDPKSLFWDPFSIVEQLGYKDKPSYITYGTLKAITYKLPIVQAIIQTRINQVASFCKVQKDRYQVGFKIKTRDTEKEPTKAEKKWIQQAEMLLMRTGITDNPRGRDSLETFCRKLMWDSLTYDQFCYEIVPNRKGLPAEWYAVDAATIRLADTASTYVDEDIKNAVRFVQIYDGMIIAEYTQEELAFGVRNPRTDIRLQGYGVSELEMLITTITSLLYAFEFNTKFFTQGSAAKGIINFKGSIPERELQNFRKQWYTQIASVENAWRTPITNSEELQYINMQTSARDMEFNAWMDFLIKITCAIFTIDPVEVNFKYGNTGQKGGLQEANNREKITESKERGLRPLLGKLADSFNKNIVWPMNESFEFAFVGLDANTRDDVVETNMKRVKSFMTVDELRAEDDLEPLPDGKGELILDPTYLQFAQMKDQAAQGAEGQPGAAPGGQPGQPGGQPPGGQAGPQGAQPEEGGEDKDKYVADDEYKKMLSQYGEDEDEDEGEEEEKSLTKSWVVTL